MDVKEFLQVENNEEKFFEKNEKCEMNEKPEVDKKLGIDKDIIINEDNEQAVSTDWMIAWLDTNYY